MNYHCPVIDILRERRGNGDKLSSLSSREEWGGGFSDVAPMKMAAGGERCQGRNKGEEDDDESSRGHGDDEAFCSDVTR